MTYRREAGDHVPARVAKQHHLWSLRWVTHLRHVPTPCLLADHEFVHPDMNHGCEECKCVQIPVSGWPLLRFRLRYLVGAT